MPITLTVEERDAMSAMVEAQKGSLEAAWKPFAAHEWEKAEVAFRHHLQDCHFLEYLHLQEPDASGRVSVGMRPSELREVLVRARAKRTAQLVVEESSSLPVRPEQETFQAQARLAMKTCERSIGELAMRYEVRYAIVDTATGAQVGSPLASLEAALDHAEQCNAMNGSPSGV